MADFGKGNWVAILARSRGISPWKLMDEMGKGSAAYGQQRKKLSVQLAMLCSYHDFGFTWDEIGAALEEHRKLGMESEDKE